MTDGINNLKSNSAEQPRPKGNKHRKKELSQTDSYLKDRIVFDSHESSTIPSSRAISPTAANLMKRMQGLTNEADNEARFYFDVLQKSRKFLLYNSAMDIGQTFSRMSLIWQLICEYPLLCYRLCSSVQKKYQLRYEESEEEPGVEDVEKRKRIFSTNLDDYSQFLRNHYLLCMERLYDCCIDSGLIEISGKESATPSESTVKISLDLDNFERMLQQGLVTRTAISPVSPNGKDSSSSASTAPRSPASRRSTRRTLSKKLLSFSSFRQSRSSNLVPSAPPWRYGIAPEIPIKQRIQAYTNYKNECSSIFKLLDSHYDPEQCNAGNDDIFPHDVDILKSSSLQDNYSGNYLSSPEGSSLSSPSQSELKEKNSITQNQIFIQDSCNEPPIAPTIAGNSERNEMTRRHSAGNPLSPRSMMSILNLLSESSPSNSEKISKKRKLKKSKSKQRARAPDVPIKLKSKSIDSSHSFESENSDLRSPRSLDIPPANPYTPYDSSKESYSSMSESSSGACPSLQASENSTNSGNVAIQTRKASLSLPPPVPDSVSAPSSYPKIPAFNNKGGINIRRPSVQVGYEQTYEYTDESSTKAKGELPNGHTEEKKKFRLNKRDRTSSPDLVLYYIKYVENSVLSSAWWTGRETIMEVIGDNPNKPNNLESNKQDEVNNEFNNNNYNSSNKDKAEESNLILDININGSIGRQSRRRKLMVQERDKRKIEKIKKENLRRNLHFNQSILLPIGFPDLIYEVFIFDKKGFSRDGLLKIARPGVVLIDSKQNIATKYYPYNLISNITVHESEIFELQIGGLIRKKFLCSSRQIVVEEILCRKRYIQRMMEMESDMRGTDTDEIDECGQTSLHRAASNNKYKEIKQLINKAYNVNACDRNGWTPLHCAAAGGHLDIVWILIQNPLVEINALSKDGTSPLQYLLRFQTEDPITMAKVTMMWNFLRDKGASLQLTDNKGNSLLHQLVLRRRSKAVEWLLLKKCDPNCASITGETPLHYAVRVDSPEIIGLLMKAKADVTRECDNFTPLSLAQTLKLTRSIAELTSAQASDSKSQTADPRTRISVSDPRIRVSDLRSPNSDSRLSASSDPRSPTLDTKSGPPNNLNNTPPSSSPLFLSPFNLSTSSSGRTRATSFGGNEKKIERVLQAKLQSVADLKIDKKEGLTGTVIKNLTQNRNITKLKLLQFHADNKPIPVEWVVEIKGKNKLFKYLNDVNEELRIAALSTLCHFAWPFEIIPGLQKELSSKQYLKLILYFAKRGQLEIHRKVDPNEIKFIEVIGRGATSYVYKGTWNDELVAIKVPSIIDDDIIMEMRNEATIMTIMNQRNLIKCKGANFSQEITFIITEYYAKGTLSSIIYNPNYCVSMYRRISIAKSIAKGMSSLHSLHIIHRDLKSMNILLGNNNRAIVMDFGESCLIDDQLESNIGTPAWIAPEVFGEENQLIKYNEKADVYSFGMLLFELATRKMPFEDLKSYKIPDAVKAGFRPKLNPDCPKQLYELIKQCWEPDIANRPTFIQIYKILKDLATVLKKEKM